MFSKSFLSLVITALLANAAAANASKAPQDFPQPAAVGCQISMQWNHVVRRDRLADTAIGGLSSLSEPFGSLPVNSKIVLPSAPRGSSHPLLLAALEMAPAVESNGAPSSCYPPLSLATTSVPEARAGVAYSVALAANGGQPPYGWSFGQSSLPAGFSIDPTTGSLTGTPTAAGTYTFNVIVSDSLKNNLTGAMVLIVAGENAQLPPTNVPPTNPPPTPPPTQQPPIGPATGTALTSCGDIKRGGTYYLANDVSSAGVCFGIDANGIKLNLNGHTITYGTGGGAKPTPAIEGHDCWYTSGNLTGGYCGSAHGGAEVYGGNIIQSANCAPFSPVFSFGQGNFNAPPNIHDITASVQNQGGSFYYSQFVPVGAIINHNTVYDNVTNIQLPGQGMLSARSQFQGEAIFISTSEDNPGTGDTISNNTIVGSPQGGIRTTNQYSTITGNDVSMDSWYTNDYCFEVSADHTTVSNNNCHPISGRGINIDASYVTVSNNTFNTTELKQNAEYGGCEIGGGYGIRFKDITYNANMTGMVGDVITGNTVTVVAGPCSAVGLNFSIVPANAQISITNNTFTTVNLGQGQPDYAIGLSSHGDGVSITGNAFNSTSAYIDGEWDGYGNFTVGHNTWLGAPALTVFSEDGQCDPKVGGNVDPVCPASVTITDNLPNKVHCAQYSEATVTIAGHLTQCIGQ